MKKKENAALRTQVQQYEKLLNEVSREIEDGQSKIQLEASRTSKQAEPQNSKLKSQKSESVIDSKRYDNIIAHLNKVIAVEKGKVRELKNLYMREMTNKS